MKTAILHYWLTNLRGGEKVLAALGDMFPEADVFTHALGKGMRDRREVEKRGGGGEWNGHPVHESLIARLPFGRMWPQAYLPLMPAASRLLRLDGYDLIISSESGPIKGICKPRDAKHICYCHTPMRYVWDLYDAYYAATGLCGKLAMRLFTPYLRREDLKSVASVDTFVANSQFVADRIRRLYGRDAAVVHPPVDIRFFSESRQEKGDYYLYAGELRAYKCPDLAVRACLRMGRKLVVVGNGRMRESLMREVAGNPNVRFLGRVPDDALREIYGGARALLFPGVEDFGIVPVEAQAAGTPVVAFGGGGVLETVVKDSTGLFFGEQTVDALCGAIEEFESRSWAAETCRAQARCFEPDVFRRGFARVVAAAIGREL